MLGRLPSEIVATQVFPHLDWASHFQFARTSSYYYQVSRLPQASPVEVSEVRFRLALQWRPEMRPRRFYGWLLRSTTFDGQSELISAFTSRVTDIMLWSSAFVEHYSIMERLLKLEVRVMPIRGWRRLADGCRRLRNFRAFSVTDDVGSPLRESALAPYPPTLTALGIASTGMPFSDIIALSANKELASLEIHCAEYHAWTKEAWPPSLQFPKLTKLQLDGELANDDLFKNLTPTHFPKLQHLTLSGTCGMISPICSLSLLTALDIGMCSFRGLSYHPPLPRLVSLRESIYCVPDMFTAPMYGSTLTELAIGYPILTLHIECVQMLTKMFPKLRHLVLDDVYIARYARDIEKMALLEAVLKYNVRLQTIVLHDVKRNVRAAASVARLAHFLAHAREVDVPIGWPDLIEKLASGALRPLFNHKDLEDERLLGT